MVGKRFIPSISPENQHRIVDYIESKEFTSDLRIWHDRILSLDGDSEPSQIIAVEEVEMLFAERTASRYHDNRIAYAGILFLILNDLLSIYDPPALSFLWTEVN